MGRVLTGKSINDSLVDSISTAIILINQESEKIIEIGEYEKVDVNRILMIEIKKLRDRKQTILIDDLFLRIYDIKGKKIILRNFGILFDPVFKLDVLKFFEKLSNRAKIIVEWPGIYRENILIYSEPQYEDYAKYNLSDYNITLIVERG